MSAFSTFTLTPIQAGRTSTIVVANSGLKVGSIILVGPDRPRTVTSVSGGGLVIGISGTFAINATGKTQVLKQQGPTPRLMWAPSGSGAVVWGEAKSPSTGLYAVTAVAIFESADANLSVWQSAAGQLQIYDHGLIVSPTPPMAFGAARAASVKAITNLVHKGDILTAVGQARALFPDTPDTVGGVSTLTPLQLGVFVAGST